MTPAEVNQKLFDQLHELQRIVVEERASKQQLRDPVRQILSRQSSWMSRTSATLICSVVIQRSGQMRFFCGGKPSGGLDENGTRERDRDPRGD